MLFSPSPKRSRRLQLRISERRLLLMFGDALCVVGAVLLALYVWSMNANTVFDIAFVLPQSYWFFVLIGLWLLVAGANDFFELSIAANLGQTLQRLAVITLQMLVVYLLVFFFSPRDALPRLFIIYYGVSSFAFIAVWRMVNPALIGWASTPRRMLVVGAGPSAETIIEAISSNNGHGYEICGIISLPEEVGSVLCGVPVIGTGEDMLNFVKRDRITELVITSVPEYGDDIFRGVMQAYEMGVELLPMPILYERITGRVPVRHVNNNWALVLPLKGQSIFNPYQVVQRMFDIVLSIIGMAFFLLLLPIVALLIRLDSPGGVFYSQIRTGLNGRHFRIYKFRTMVQDAEKNTGAVFSERGDPRVTRVGWLLRRTRLDELPQVFNVLKGDMAIVGPRPERPEHIDRLTESIPFYRTRLVVRPGLTGWAQVRYDYGSNDVDAMVKLEYDLYYIRNQSVLLDVNIIIRTVGKVLRMAGV